MAAFGCEASGMDNASCLQLRKDINGYLDAAHAADTQGDLVGAASGYTAALTALNILVDFGQHEASDEAGKVAEDLLALVTNKLAEVRAAIMNRARADVDRISARIPGPTVHETHHSTSTTTGGGGGGGADDEVTLDFSKLEDAAMRHKGYEVRTSADGSTKYVLRDDSDRAKDDPPIMFADVAGALVVKKRMINEFMLPLLAPKLMGKMAKGILLHGPPGTGKTNIVNATINEMMNLDTFDVYRVEVHAADLKGKYVGSTSKNVRALFEGVRALRDARREYNKKEGKGDKRVLVVLFMDEVESVVSSRSGDNLNRSVATQEVLKQMDGADKKANEGIVVMATSNLPDDLDPAFLRRISSMFHMGLPSVCDLVEIQFMVLDRYLRDAFGIKAKSQGFVNGESDLVKLQKLDKLYTPLAMHRALATGNPAAFFDGCGPTDSSDNLAPLLKEFFTNVMKQANAMSQSLFSQSDAVNHMHRSIRTYANKLLGSTTSRHTGCKTCTWLLSQPKPHTTSTEPTQLVLLNTNDGNISLGGDRGSSTEYDGVPLCARVGDSWFVLDSDIAKVLPRLVCAQWMSIIDLSGAGQKRGVNEGDKSMVKLNEAFANAQGHYRPPDVRSLKYGDIRRMANAYFFGVLGPAKANEESNLWNAFWKRVRNMGKKARALSVGGGTGVAVAGGALLLSGGWAAALCFGTAAAIVTTSGMMFKDGIISGRTFTGAATVAVIMGVIGYSTLDGNGSTAETSNAEPVPTQFDMKIEIGVLEGAYNAKQKDFEEAAEKAKLLRGTKNPTSKDELATLTKRREEAYAKEESYKKKATAAKKTLEDLQSKIKKLEKKHVTDWDDWQTEGDSAHMNNPFKKAQNAINTAVEEKRKYIDSEDYKNATEGSRIKRMGELNGDIQETQDTYDTLVAARNKYLGYGGALNVAKNFVADWHQGNLGGMITNGVAGLSMTVGAVWGLYESFRDECANAGIHITLPQAKEIVKAIQASSTVLFEAVSLHPAEPATVKS